MYIHIYMYMCVYIYVCVYIYNPNTHIWISSQNGIEKLW